MLAFDWDHKSVTVFDGETVTEFPDLFALLDSLDEPTKLVGEATFESFDVEAREWFRQRCLDEGHTLRSVPNRLTPRARQELGLEKSDDADVRAIWHLAQSGMHLHTPKAPDPVFIERATALRDGYMCLRRSEDQDKIWKDTKKVLREHDPEGFAEHGPLLSPSVAVSMMVAALGSKSRRDFERIVGLHVHGFPNIFRSQAMFHGWRPKRDKGKFTRSQFRKALRWLYHKVRELSAGKIDPETGKLNPLSTLASYVTT